MKKQSLILHIPHPCTVPWDEMAPAAGGRFCDHCQKKVVDFSTMTDNELLAAIGSSNGKICGRLHPAQQNRLLAPDAPQRRGFLPAAIIASFLAAIVPGSSKAEKPATDTTISPLVKKGADTKRDISDSLTGRIVDSTTHAALPGVVVSISGVNVSTVTDAEGKFQLIVPAELKGYSISLKTNFIGYDQKCIPFSVEQLSRPINIGLQASMVGLTEVVLVGAIQPRRTSFWRKVTKPFRKR